MYLTTLAFLFLLLFVPCPTLGVWTRFDLVRSRQKGWKQSKTHGYGSNGSIAFAKISGLYGNGPITEAGSKFGYSVANIGDIDGGNNHSICLFIRLFCFKQEFYMTVFD